MIHVYLNIITNCTGYFIYWTYLSQNQLEFRQRLSGEQNVHFYETKPETKKWVMGVQTLIRFEQQNYKISFVFVVTRIVSNWSYW